MDFEMMQSVLRFLKSQNAFPKLDGKDIAEEKLIHHTVKIDTIDLMEQERKYLHFLNRFSFLQSENPSDLR